MYLTHDLFYNNRFDDLRIYQKVGLSTYLNVNIPNIRDVST